LICCNVAGPPSTRNVCTKTRLFVVAPTVIAEGADPGEEIEFSVGIFPPVSPSFPALATTTIPARIAFSTAST
jgi:hypothetical protein